MVFFHQISFGRLFFLLLLLIFVGDDYDLFFCSSEISFGRWGGVDHCEVTGAFFGVYLLWRQSWNHKVKPP